jgi:hypothetical protein
MLYSIKMIIMISLKKDVILYIHYIKEMQLVLNNFKLYGEVVEID